MLFWLFCAFYVSISYKNARIRSWWYLHRYYSSDCNSLWLGHFKQEQHSDLYAYAISRNLNKIQTRKLHKLNQFVYALFTQRKKKALTIARKCLIFRVDQPGLEPGTSRLWVWENDILWFFIAINFIDTQIITNFAVVYDMPINSVSKHLCFPIVFPKNTGI